MRERHILERAVRVVAEQAVAVDGVVDDAIEVGLGGFHQLTVHAKMLRLELMNAKSALERDLTTLSRASPTFGSRALSFAKHPDHDGSQRAER
jgi:hypothetical protein